MNSIKQYSALLTIFILICVSAFAAPPSKKLQLDVDATEASRNILHAKIRMAATAGPMTLVFPKWLPGNHRPAGLVQNLAGFSFEADGKVLTWQRDPVDMYAIHLEIPSGARELQVKLDAITDEGVAGSSGPAASTQLLDVNWNMVMLYPAGENSDDIEVTASVRLPQGWKAGCALEIAEQNGNQINFKPVSLTTLVDSPLIAGAHFKRIELDRDHDPLKHAINMVAENDEDLAITADQIGVLNNLVTETGKLFGARHYRHYDLLLTLSSQVGGRGLEHHESSDNGPGERFLIDANSWMLEGSLLPHEFTHSWNGKYRRPAGLVIKNYQQPMIGDLLWVYEGLTNYLGEVLAARSGFWTAEQFRESVALTAASMDNRRGRDWRPLEDAAVSVQSLRLQGASWSNWRRGLDYYPEGALIWLDVDTEIRRLSKGQKSLDDFCRSFHGGESGPPKVVGYKLDDIVRTLNEVVANDWAAMLNDRVKKIQTHAPMGGITNGGWKLVYSSKPNVFSAAAQEESRNFDLSYSLGMVLDRNGKIVDIVVGSAVSRAGLAPRMTIVAVNGRKYSKDLLRDMIKSAAESRKPIALLVEYAEYMQTYNVEYFDGLRNPHLEKVAGAPDLLEAIVKPRRDVTTK